MCPALRNCWLRNANDATPAPSCLRFATSWVLKSRSTTSPRTQTRPLTVCALWRHSVLILRANSRSRRRAPSSSLASKWSGKSSTFPTSQRLSCRSWWLQTWLTAKRIDPRKTCHEIKKPPTSLWPHSSTRSTSSMNRCQRRPLPRSRTRAYLKS